MSKRNKVLKKIEKAKPLIRNKINTSKDDKSFWLDVFDTLESMQHILERKPRPTRLEKLNTSIAEMVVHQFPTAKDSHHPLVKLLCEIGDGFCTIGIKSRDNLIEEKAILHYQKYKNLECGV